MLPLSCEECSARVVDANDWEQQELRALNATMNGYVIEERKCPRCPNVLALERPVAEVLAWQQRRIVAIEEELRSLRLALDDLQLEARGSDPSYG